METFDKSLKYLLHEEPADFLQFGFADPLLEVLGPCETGLPARGRDVDGSYFVMHQGQKVVAHKVVAHVEFHRRHQSLEELAIDVAEAQIRLYRRERCPVVTHVWDLYGDRTGPRMKARKLKVGPGTSSTYVRINLRAANWQHLLRRAPPALWPLVPLTRNGATANAVKAARDAIASHFDQNSSRQADHLAVLWFVAEAEDVPAELIKTYITRAQLMESALYKSIFADGKAEGEARGLSQGISQGLSMGAIQAHAYTISKILARHLGSVDPSARTFIESFPDRGLVAMWHDEALELDDAESARKFLDKVLHTPVPAVVPS